MDFDFDDEVYSTLLEDDISSLLLEADGEETEEPTEQDADMGSDGDMGEGEDDTAGDDEGGDDMGDDMGGDEGGEDDTGGGDSSGGGMGETDPAANLSPTEATKKRRLFLDYKNLLFIMEKAMEQSGSIDYYSMSEDGKKIFNYLERKINENHDKMLIIMTEQYSKLPYSQLLTLYMYMKIAVKSYSDILMTLFDRTVE